MEQAFAFGGVRAGKLAASIPVVNGLVWNRQDAKVRIVRQNPRAGFQGDTDDSAYASDEGHSLLRV